MPFEGESDVGFLGVDFIDSSSLSIFLLRYHSLSRYNREQDVPLREDAMVNVANEARQEPLPRTCADVQSAAEVPRTEYQAMLISLTSTANR